MIISLILCLVTFMKSQDIRAQVENVTKKPLASSKKGKTDLGLKTDELWLLWSLEKIDELKQQLPGLLQKYPDHFAFINIACLLSIKEKNLIKANEYIKKLETLSRIPDQAYIILELKAVNEILPIHDAQLMTYLKITGLKLGLIINFNVKLLKDGIERIIL